MLVFLHAALGLTLGWLRPGWAVAVLLGGISVSSSVWWQLGLGNVAAPLAYVVGFLLGTALRAATASAADDEQRLPRDVVLAGTLTVAFVLAATLLSVLREHFADTLMLTAPEAARQIFDFNAGGLAGELQAATIAIAGPLLLFATTAALHGVGARRLAMRAVVVGATIAVVVPFLQGLLSNPWVRPDKDGLPGTGLVGSFQDPHSFAAYLLLVVGVVTAAGANAWRAEKRRAASAYALLATMMVVVLIGTNSRTGIIGLVVVGVCLLAARAGPRARSGRGRALLVPAGAVAAALVALTLLFSVAPLRRAAYDGLRDVGANRIAQPLAADADWDLLLGYRRVRWAATLEVTTQRPLWGAGPRSIEKIPLGEIYSPRLGRVRQIPSENAHNYFLQFAAEYGLPAFAALIWLLVGVLSIAARGAARHPSAATRTLLAGLLAGQIGFLVFSLVAHPMLLAEGQSAFWGLCGLALSLARGDDP